MSGDSDSNQYVRAIYAITIAATFFTPRKKRTTTFSTFSEARDEMPDR